MTPEWSIPHVAQWSVSEPLRSPDDTCERLSERELDVLHYLPTILTADEIGAELYISVNTVKAHMKSIYRKLDATRRREACDQARRVGIL
jgi:LuxR family transcriptional regulator, maltose regulon positive regulatory protein